METIEIKGITQGVVHGQAKTRPETETEIIETWGKCYIGTKIIRAEPMDDHTFKKSKGIDTSNIETMGDGYRVQYDDGYISWSPKEVFERCYRPITKQEIGITL